MKVLTGSEAKAVALSLDPKNPDKRITCPLCMNANLNVEKIEQPDSNRFSLMVSCPSCQMITHFIYAGE